MAAVQSIINNFRVVKVFTYWHFLFQIPIAGNSSQAKYHVSALVGKLGYQVTDLGSLDKSRIIENIPLSLFLSWRKPLVVSTCLWFFLFLMTFRRYHFCAKNKLGWYPEEMFKMPTKYINKTCDNHALIMLAICYLPGIISLPFRCLNWFF